MYPFLEQSRKHFELIHRVCLIIADKFNINIDVIWAIISPNNTINDFIRHFYDQESRHSNIKRPKNAYEYLYEKKKIIMGKNPDISFLDLYKTITNIDNKDEDMEEAKKLEEEDKNRHAREMLELQQRLQYKNERQEVLSKMQQ